MILSFLFRSVLSGRGIRSQIGTLTLDVTLNEIHNRNSEVTEFPIERGSIISDHVLLRPKTLQIVGFVSDTPVSSYGFSLGNSRASSAFLQLEGLWQLRIPFVVISQLAVYRNMVIEDLRIPKTNESALRFNCVLKQLNLVSGQNVLMPATADQSLQNDPTIAANGGGARGLSAGNVTSPAQDATGIDVGRQTAPPATVTESSGASSLLRILGV